MKKIFFTLLFCGTLGLALSFFITDISSAQTCESNTDCTETLCHDGLTYGYYCCLEETACEIDWAYGRCLIEGALENAWCEQGCCSNYCLETFNLNGICIAGSATVPARCVCSGRASSAPSCWTGPEEGFLKYEDLCGDGICNWEWGEDTRNINSECYCDNDCKQCGDACRYPNQCVEACPRCIGGACSAVPGAVSGEEEEREESRGTDGSGSIFKLENPLEHDTFEEILGAVSKFLFQVGMALAPLMLVIAGFMYVTSAGSPTRVQTAQRMALYTVIGLAIILLASGLIAVLKSIIGYQG